MKSLRTFIADMRRAYPSEVVSIAKTVNPLTYDVTAIVKQLGALKKFPVLVFEQPLNAHGSANDMKLVMSAENSQKKIQVALGIPAETDRAEMARECLRREAAKIGPVIVRKDAAPVKEIIQTGALVDLCELPLLRHHEMDGGPYIDMSSVARDRGSGVYNCSYHRMEIKDRNHTGFLMTLQHMWRIFRGYEEANEECPIATVIGHHPAYQMGACYGGPFEVSEYEIIGGGASNCLCPPMRRSSSKAHCSPANEWSKDRSAKLTVIWACKVFNSRRAMKCARSRAGAARCIPRSSRPKVTSRGWIWREKAPI